MFNYLHLNFHQKHGIKIWVEKIFHFSLILINEKFWSQICVVIGCKFFYFNNRENKKISF
ncbi:hypothetical protein A2468_01270 [Candidatus Falkowbacteria bacterium RIFOXYC2_FULL_46_15]|uniref:Uncharacterized protein n=1 Tax=Candidatus Falkowbacteria bacterium RIFOXYA2_FULL_47_19 TaxID=1797994 RepID=A0A1F5SKN3_9BACT|nr:MAG: hypothetical protein A2227_04330 [Candidatus Falkowbacteria bacterium RIFOXYA2_FULL_47_19]OGF36987.1 MAG: hypothetical protein A2468_01270 [Candidatus Falkowbacteria bacterium RIFOXYC2_FULL_46_15]